MESKKCIMSLRTSVKTKKFLGKLTFLIKEALPKNTVEEEFTEFENHCHGNNPAIKNKA